MTERPTKPASPLSDRVKRHADTISDLHLFLKWAHANGRLLAIWAIAKKDWPPGTIPRTVEQQIADYLGIDLDALGIEQQATHRYMLDHMAWAMTQKDDHET